MKEIYELLNYFWTFRKNKRGLFVACFLASGACWTIIFKFFSSEKQIFQTGIIWNISILIAFFLFWFLSSGRFIFPSNKFTVVFSLKAKDMKSNLYIQDAISKLNRELEILGLRDKFRIVLAGQDFIDRIKLAHRYRERFNIDLVIWGEIYSGTKNEKVVCDFKDLFFTYKIPPQVINANLSNLFKSDINISIVNRDWNIYEINSLPDTEKISGHLSEIIMFIVGIIYCQYKEYGHESINILENLFNLLEKKTAGEQPNKSQDGKTVTMSTKLFYKARVLSILIRVYYNLGLYLMEHEKFSEARFYFEKYLSYEATDIEALSNAAFCAFKEENGIASAKKYTEGITKIDKYNEFYLTNQAFFDIWEKDYSGAFFYYMLLIKKGKEIQSDIITKVIAFLDERKKDNENEIGYDFAIGFLDYHFMEKSTGELELLSFQKLAEGREEYNQMVNYVKENIVKGKKNTRK